MEDPPDGPTYASGKTVFAAGVSGVVPLMSESGAFLLSHVTQQTQITRYDSMFVQSDKIVPLFMLNISPSSSRCRSSDVRALAPSEPVVGVEGRHQPHDHCFF